MTSPTNEQQRAGVLAKAMFATYSRNGGHSPSLHYDRIAAEHWMAQALIECGVAELLEYARRVMEPIEPSLMSAEEKRLVSVITRLEGRA